MSVILGLESTPERALAASIDKRDREIVRMNEVIRRLDAETAEWHEKVLRQERVIEAAREFGPCWLSPGKPCGECLVCKLNRSLAALEGKPPRALGNPTPEDQDG